MASVYRTLTLSDLAEWPGSEDRIWMDHVAHFHTVLSTAGHPMLNAAWRADHVLMLVLQRGALVVTTEEDELRIGAGQGVMLLPTTLRRFRAVGADAQVTVLAFTPNFLAELAWKPFQDGAWRLTMERGGPKVMAADDMLRIQEPLLRLGQRIEHLSLHPRGRDLVRNTFLELCLEFSAKEECSEQQAAVVNGRKEELVARFVELAQQLHSGRRRLSYYSDRLAVTSKHLSETVKDVTGRTAMQVLDDLLVSRSKRLLHERGLSISQVAYDLAFGDPAVFSKFFKRMTGRSPREFRAEVV